MSERLILIGEKENNQTIAREWLKKRGIELVLWDLDDTLLKTHDLFLTKIKAYLDQCLGNVDLERRSFLETRFHQIIAEVHKERSVNPVIWGLIAGRFLEEFPDLPPDPVLATGLVMEVYQTAPALLPGALEILDTFAQAGVRMAVLTHASPEWTEVKIKTHHLEKYFEQSLTVSVDEKKGAEHWSLALALLKVNPIQVLAIGDSVKGDMQAAASAGIGYLINPISSWQVYQEGDLPEGAWQIAGLTEIFTIFKAG